MRISNFGAILLGLLFLSVSVFITAILFGWTSPLQNLMQTIYENTVYSGLTAIAFLILSILSLSMIRVGERDRVAVSTSTQFGQIRISDRTIEGIVTRAGLNVEGIKEVSPRIHPLQEGMNILIKAVTNPDFVIPQVVENLQVLVKQDVEKYTGLKVAEVRVMVQNIDTPSSIRMR